MRTVRVEASSAYDVLIGPGLLGECGARIAKVIAPCTAALVSDSNVAPLYLRAYRSQSDDAHGLAGQLVERPAQVGKDGTGGIVASFHGSVEIRTVPGEGQDMHECLLND